MGAGRGGRRASATASGIRRGEDALSQAGLFESESSRGDPAPTGPLAARVRPRNLADFVGQGHLLGPDRPLRRMIESGRAYSMVFWGPPGTGKTTLARLIAAHCEAQFLALSAVMAGVKDIRNAVDDARRHRARAGADTILFVDEAHRFNKAQQDAFLPFVEDGTLVFIGATTENPSFELNNALLSRARVYVLTALAPAEIRVIIDRALRADDAGRGIEVPEAIRDQVAAAADGDARRALNTLELLLELAGAEGRAEADEELLGRVLSGGGARRFDKGGDAFYDQISPRCTSRFGVRTPTPPCTLAGPHAGRGLRSALHRPGASCGRPPRTSATRTRGRLAIAVDAWDVQTRLGSPEGELANRPARPPSISPARPRATPVYKAFGRRDAGCLPSSVRRRCPCTCATPPPR